MQTVYRIEIEGVTAAAPGDGFIDSKKIEHYMAAGSVPTTYAQTTAKERGNLRYETLIAKLQEFANIGVINIEATAATSTTEASTFAFTAVVDRGDTVLVTVDEENPGTYLEGEDALKRAVARSLIVGKVDFGEVYDPTPTTGPNNEVSVARTGSRITRVEFTPLAANLTAAETLVTVTKISI